MDDNIDQKIQNNTNEEKEKFDQKGVPKKRAYNENDEVSYFLNSNFNCPRTPELSNARYKKILSEGKTIVSLIKQKYFVLSAHSCDSTNNYLKYIEAVNGLFHIKHERVPDDKEEYDAYKAKKSHYNNVVKEYERQDFFPKVQEGLNNKAELLCLELMYPTYSHLIVPNLINPNKVIVHIYDAVMTLMYIPALDEFNLRINKKFVTQEKAHQKYTVLSPDRVFMPPFSSIADADEFRIDMNRKHPPKVNPNTCRSNTFRKYLVSKNQKEYVWITNYKAHLSHYLIVSDNFMNMLYMAATRVGEAKRKQVRRALKFLLYVNSKSKPSENLYDPEEKRITEFEKKASTKDNTTVLGKTIDTTNKSKLVLDTTKDLNLIIEEDKRLYDNQSPLIRQKKVKASPKTIN